MSYESSSTLVRVGLLLSIMGLLATCTASTTPYWLTSDSIDTQLGMWYYCTAGECSTESSSPTPTWLTAAIVMVTLGFAFAMPCCLFTVLYVFVPRTSGKRWVKATAAALAFTAAAMMLIAVIVCAAKKDDFPEVFPGFRPTFVLGWSFAVAVVAALLFLATGLTFTLETVCN